MTAPSRGTRLPGLVAFLCIAPVLACLRAGAQPVISGPGAAVQQTSRDAAGTDFVPDPTAPFLDWAGFWPARWNRGDAPLMGVVRSLDVNVTTLQPRRLTGVRPPTDDDSADFALLARGAPDAPTPEMEGANAVLFRPATGSRARGLGSGPGPDAGPPPASVFRFISGQPSQPGRILLQRTWFAYYEPVGEKTESGRAPAPPTKAAVLLMPGIFGNPEPTVDALTLALRQRGYAVLRMLAQPSRFTEHVTLTIDAGDLESSARAVAATFDDRTAECAYAAEAAWDFVEQHRPALKPLPRLAIGMSGGAITLPTVVARQKDRYCTAVLVGGAADYWLTSQRSNYREMIGATTTLWEGPEPTQTLQRELDTHYLKHAPLDSFHTAAVLHGKPVLVLQGLADRAVPSALGDVLWERLGRPERWTYPLGHEMLFAGLPAEFPRLLDWLDAAIQKSPPAPPGP